MHEGVEVFAVFEIARWWWQGGGDGARGVDLGDAVEADEFVHIVAGGDGSREEDKIVSLWLECVGIAAGDD